MIGHELNALYGLDHAQTLALVLPKLLGLQHADEKILAAAAINATENFFNSVGVSTHFASYGKDRSLLSAIPERLAKKGMFPLGEKRNINEAEVETIVSFFLRLRRNSLSPPATKHCMRKPIQQQKAERPEAVHSHPSKRANRSLSVFSDLGPDAFGFVHACRSSANSDRVTGGKS